MDFMFGYTDDERKLNIKNCIIAGCLFVVIVLILLVVLSYIGSFLPTTTNPKRCFELTYFNGVNTNIEVPCDETDGHKETYSLKDARVMLINTISSPPLTVHTFVIMPGPSVIVFDEICITCDNKEDSK